MNANQAIGLAAQAKALALIAPLGAPYAQNVGAVVADFNGATVGSWTGTRATLSSDTANFLDGASALKVTATSTTALDAVAAQTVTSFDASSTAAWIKLRFYISAADAANVSLVYVTLFDASGFNRGFYLWYPAPNGKSGWNEISIPISEYSFQSGTPPTLSAITKVTVAFTPVTGLTPSVTFDQVQVFTPTTKRTKGQIMVGMDGTYSQQAAAIAWMTARGLPVTLASGSAYLDIASHLSTAQLKSYQQAGHLIIPYAGSILPTALADVTASIAGITLTVTAVADGVVTPGQAILSGAASNTLILSQLTGTSGGIGTYQVSTSQTVSSAAMSLGAPLWAAMTDAQKLYVVQHAQAWARANGFHPGARTLSLSGAAGWTASDDASLLGPYLDCMTAADVTGSQYQQSVLPSPYASLGWFNGETTTTRVSMNFATLCTAVNNARGVLVYWAHLNDATVGGGTDNVSTFTTNMAAAISAGLDFITPLEFTGQRYPHS